MEFFLKRKATEEKNWSTTLDYLSYFSVIALSMLELWAAIPLGFVLKLNPFFIFALTSFGVIAGVILVSYVGDGIRSWLLAKHPPRANGDQKSFVLRTWDKYGIIGLSFIAPLITGAPIGAAIAIGLGEKRGRTLFWMSIGAVIWSGIFTALGYIGVISILH